MIIVQILVILYNLIIFGIKCHRGYSHFASINYDSGIFGTILSILIIFCDIVLQGRSFIIIILIDSFVDRKIIGIILLLIILLSKNRIVR